MARPSVSFLYKVEVAFSTSPVYTRGVKSVVVIAARHSAPADPHLPILCAVTVGPRLRFHPDGPVCVLLYASVKITATLNKGLTLK